MAHEDSLEEVVHRSEQHLILNEFKEAEVLARDVLKRTIYDPGHGEVEERAAVVFIQALYETQRFSSVKGELASLFGRLPSAPVSALLLYLSLALDFADRRLEAQALTLDLLHSSAPGGPSPWSRRQYAALLHLYVFELLLPELREPAQAARWLADTDMPIPAALRASMAAELSEAFPPGAAAPPLSGRSAAVGELRRNSAARGAVPRRSGVLEGALDALRGAAPDSAASPSASASASPGSASPLPREGSGEAVPQGGLEDWLGRGARSWRDTIASLAGGGGSEGGASEGGEVSSAPAPEHDPTPYLASGALLLLLGYAVVLRRRQVAAGAHGALRALGDVMRMGLQLSPGSIPR